MHQDILRSLAILCVGTAALALSTHRAQATLPGFPHLEPGDPNDVVTLGELVSGAIDGIVVGDKIFTEFSYLATGDMPKPENINVVGLFVQENYGVRFQGGFKDLFDDGNESSDALIEFTVSVANPSLQLISDVHLSGNPSLSGSDSLNAFAEVVESFPGSFDDLQLRIQNDLNGLIGAAWIDPLPTPVESLRVSKDIQLLSIEGVRATISRIDQTFSQTVIPEPSTVLLAVFAVVTSGISRARRRLRDR